jgi:tetratricopeptide (TPR) repeat protein
VWKRFAIFVVVLGALIAVALANQSAARQRDYRLLLMSGDELLRDESNASPDDQALRAIGAYSGAIELKRDSMLAYLRRGEAFRRRGELEPAARDFKTATGLDRSADRPLEELGDVSYQLQRYDRAVQSYDRALKLATESRLDDRLSRLTYKLGLAYYRHGQTKEAIAALEQAIRLDDRLADAHYVIGLCLLDQRRLADAAVAFKHAIAIAPGLIPAREELADLAGVLDRRSEQIDQLRKLVEMESDRVARHAALGLAYARTRHYEAAVTTIGATLEHMRDPLLYQALGTIWLESARAREDRVDLRKAREALQPIASNPNTSSDALLVAGQAAVQDGDVDEGERLLQLAAERFPIEPAALLAFAAVAERQNHPDAARRALIRHAALAGTDADFPARAIKIATLSIRVNDADTANEWIKRGLDHDPQNATLVALGGRIRRDSPAPRATAARRPGH